MIAAMKASLDVYTRPSALTSSTRCAFWSSRPTQGLRAILRQHHPLFGRASASSRTRRHQERSRQDRHGDLSSTAHELGHQWWAHQVIGADKQGGTMLSETFAQYSAMLVMKHIYGPDMSANS